MFEIELFPTILIFLAGVIVGIGAIMISNKLSSGSVSASKIKKEKDDYQAQVEAHFEETSKKFKQMANQYQDLYQHLSVGANTLCRPENIAPGLTDQRDPLSAQAKHTQAKPSKPQPTRSADSKKTGTEKKGKYQSTKTDSSEPASNKKTNPQQKQQNAAKGVNSKARVKGSSVNKSAAKNTAK